MRCSFPPLRRWRYGSYICRMMYHEERCLRRFRFDQQSRKSCVCRFCDRPGLFKCLVIRSSVPAAAGIYRGKLLLTWSTCQTTRIHATMKAFFVSDDFDVRIVRARGISFALDPRSAFACRLVVLFLLIPTLLLVCFLSVGATF